MPHYYFHLRMGAETVIPDYSGREFETDNDAQDFARRGAGFLVPGPMLSSPAFARLSLHVINEAGQTVFTLPVSDMAAEDRA
jgi:hypothetical protein